MTATTQLIETAIEQQDTPGHPDAYTVGEIEHSLDAINTDILEHWDLYEDGIDDGAHDIVFEDENVIVLADSSGHFWREQLEVTDIELDDHGILHSIIVQVHHGLARQHCDHSWSAVDPVVIEKSHEFKGGEQRALREIARRTEQTGSVARAVDQLATEVQGWSKSQWARQTGRNPSTVTRTTRDK